MKMKFFFYFCLIFSLSSKILATGICGRDVDKGVKLLHRENIYRPAFQGLAQDLYVTFPKDSDKTTKAEVVDMCVKDHDSNGFGAKPVFAYSAEDDISRYTPRITIILRGQESREINSTVEFYGFWLGENKI